VRATIKAKHHTEAERETVADSAGVQPDDSPMSAAQPKPQVLLEWRAWPAARQPRKAIATAAIILLGAFLTVLATVSLPLGLVAFVLLTLATREFFLPTRYQLTEEGASAEGFLNSYSIPWRRVKACLLSDEGVKLSPFAGKSRLEPFRGVYLRFGDNREEVVERVKELAKERGI